jgi:hypothetical protein
MKSFFFEKKNHEKKILTPQFNCNTNKKNLSVKKKNEKNP